MLHGRRRCCTPVVSTNGRFRRAHMLIHKHLITEPATQTELDNEPTNCPAVYLATWGFVNCKISKGSGQSVGQKATEVGEVGSRSVVFC